MLELQYLGTRDFKSDDGNKVYTRACFLNPHTDKIHTCDPENIVGNYKDKVCHKYVVTGFDFKQGGFIKIKSMEVFE